MDKRETLPPGESFYPLVMELYNEKKKVGILYEDSGVTRANGFIESVFEQDGKHWLKMDDQTVIAIENLYAINGKFSSDYSEC